MNLNINEIDNGKNLAKTIDKLNVNIITTNTHDSDDDDDENDLVPYDLSNDIKVTKTKQPVYLRDCLDGLVYSEEPEKIELCLKSVENLCKNYHYELNEV